MNVELSPAFILHQRLYRESSVLLDVFSEQYGRINLIAKGVRGSKRNHTGLLQLYQPLLLSWVGRGDLYTLTAIEMDKAAYILQAELALCGLYINELLVKLLPLNVPEIDVFKAYHTVLSALQNSDNMEISLRLFEKHLLMYIGYGLILEHDVETGLAIEPQQRYHYQADSGLYSYKKGQDGSSISGRSLQHLIIEQGFDQESLLEIKQLMRTVIHFYLGGKSLQSRQLFADLKYYAN